MDSWINNSFVFNSYYYQKKTKLFCFFFLFLVSILYNKHLYWWQIGRIFLPIKRYSGSSQNLTVTLERQKPNVSLFAFPFSNSNIRDKKATRDEAFNPFTCLLFSAFLPHRRFKSLFLEFQLPFSIPFFQAIWRSDPSIMHSRSHPRDPRSKPR